MTSYDYKVVPAPRRMRKVKGVKGSDELFALTLADSINEVARQGWEYVRTESFAAEAPGGWFRRAKTSEHAVMIFRREREALGPRLATVAPAETAREPGFTPPGARPADRPAERAVERVVVDRLQSTLRHQPVRLEPIVGEDDGGAAPLRPGPRLGPADKS
jgi:hypothetical protein